MERSDTLSSGLVIDELPENNESVEIVALHVDTTRGKLIFCLKLAGSAVTLILSDPLTIKGIFLSPILGHTIDYNATLIQPDEFDSEDNNEIIIASIALITSCLNSVNIIAVSPLFTINTFVPRLLGTVTNLANTNQPESAQAIRSEIANLLRSGVHYSSLMSLMIMPAFYFSHFLLTNIAGQSNSTALVAGSILRTLTWSVPSTFISIPAIQMLQSFQHVKALGVISLSLGFSLGLAYTLGSGLIFPKLGWDAVAWVYVGESYITALIAYSFLHYGERYRPFELLRNLFRRNPGDLQRFIKFMKDGIAIDLCILSEMMLYLGIAIISGIHNVGTQHILTMAIALLYLNSPLVIHTALASMIKIGNVIAKVSTNEKMTMIKLSMMTSFIGTAILPTIFSISPGIISKWYKDDREEVNTILKTLIPLAGAASVIDGFRLTLLFLLRNLEDMFGSSCIYISSQLFGVACVAVISAIYDNPHDYIGGFLAAVTVCSAALAIRLCQKVDSSPQRKASLCNRFAFWNRGETNQDGPKIELIDQLSPPEMA